MLSSIISSVLGQLATGILIFMAFVPPSKIGPGFGRFHTVLALILWILAFWGNYSVEFLALSVLLILAFAFVRKDAVYYFLVIVSILISFHMLAEPLVGETGWGRSLLVHLPPVLVLGSSAVAMLLGHWYLVAPKLSISYLKALTLGLILSILFRSAFIAEELLRSPEALAQMRFYELYGFFFLQRLALGLVLTLVFSILTYYCVRIRSTQSATGILYVVLVFSWIGELIGAYLFAKTGLML